VTDPGAIAKKAWVLVQQIDQFRSDLMPVREQALLGPPSVNSAVTNYNFLLNQARPILELDSAFSDLIADLSNVPTHPDTPDWSAMDVRATYERIVYESGRLSAALKSFVSYHLTPDEKKKIGF